MLVSDGTSGYGGHSHGGESRVVTHNEGYEGTEGGQSMLAEATEETWMVEASTTDDTGDDSGGSDIRWQEGGTDGGTDDGDDNGDSGS
jgi:hypothetical protein